MVLVPLDMSAEHFVPQGEPPLNEPSHYPQPVNSGMAAPVLDPTPQSFVANMPSEEKRHLCLLLLGPSGSGKSTFIAAAAGLDPNAGIIGHGLDSYTTTCNQYQFSRAGTLITLLDTPGLNDTSRNDLDILTTIASFLANPPAPISGVIFTHNITSNRATGSTRLALDIARGLCGPRFYPHLTLLTTMWNKLPTEEARAECVRREGQFLASPSHWGDLAVAGCQVQRFDGSRAAAERVLEAVLARAASLPVGDGAGVGVVPQMVVELRVGMPVEETGAGMVVVAERRRREREREEELIAMREEEEERLREERAQRARLDRRQGHHGRRSSSGRHHRTGSSASRSSAGGRHHDDREVRYEREDPMAYGDGGYDQMGRRVEPRVVQVNPPRPSRGNQPRRGFFDLGVVQVFFRG